MKQVQVEIRAWRSIAVADTHPRIRSTIADGAGVLFAQNGSISREPGGTVPIAYLTSDPSGSARGNIFWAGSGDVLGPLWIGLGFMRFPFFGLRAALRAGRW